MRVLHVINGLGLGGAETMLVRLLTRAKMAGIEHRVASLLPGGALAPRLREGGVVLEELDLRQGPFALIKLARVIRAWQPGIVQGWMYYGDLAATAALSLAGRRGETRLIWGLRCSDMRLDLYRPWLRWAVKLEARLSGQPDIITANSQAGRRVHEMLGYAPRRWAFVPNGIDTAQFKPDPEARTRLRAELGIAPEATLIACLARNDAMKDYPSFYAMLAQLPEHVQAFAAGIGTEDLPPAPRLHRLGRRQDVPTLLAAADLLVSPSAFGEGFSNAIGEAMAAALPVVATDIGDARLIVGPAGRIVPPGRPDALAEAVGSLLALPREDFTALGQTARARIEAEFTLEKAADRFRRLYLETDLLA